MELKGATRISVLLSAAVTSFDYQQPPSDDTTTVHKYRQSLLMSRYLQAERFEMLLVRPCFQMNPKTTKLFIVISFHPSSP